MHAVSSDTALVGISEFRKEMPKITKKIKGVKIILVNRGKPIGVLEDFEEYQEKEKLIEMFEDLVLGYIAKERYENTPKNKYLTLEQVRKKLK